ncbi:RAD52 motif-containing protein 1 isoform X2 [Coturnix japonica]|uniref:RAD52 motif-containing protein 1 isoform X2 n=1 Tax=Coturnix japonica TaxID=93934 RepID=UPI000777EC25|nr:RAD52 motif-containing protein 1 isoform X2 [Coturnix japonica]
MAEVLQFLVPTGSGQTLLVWGLEPKPGLEHSLFAVFSKFGLLYSVRAHSNAAVAGPGCYAIIKFYSAADASRAQQACNGQTLFQSSPLKVCVCTKQKGFQQQVLALNSNKCQELANHYLGFNGWSSRIITLQNVSGFDDENEEVGKKPSVRYLCAVEVTLPKHGVQSRGVGLGEADLENGEDPLELVTATRRVQKLAAGRALSSAFQKILLVVLGQAPHVMRSVPPSSLTQRKGFHAEHHLRY